MTLRFLLASLFTASVAPGGPVSYMLTLDTSGLMGLPSPPSPFALVFDLLNNDDLAGNNTVSITQIGVPGTGAFVNPPITSGGVAGTFPSPVMLTDSGTYRQQFVPGTSMVFSISADNLYSGIGPFFDTLSLYMLSGEDEFFHEVETEGLGVLGVNLLFGLDFTGEAPAVWAFASADPAVPFTAPEVLETGVPEPGTLALFASGAALLASRTRRRRAARS